MIILDISIVLTGLPQIRDELGFSTVGLSWVQNAYLLVFGGLLLLGARAGDLLGRRRYVHGRARGLHARLPGDRRRTVGACWLLMGRAAQGLGAAILRTVDPRPADIELPRRTRAHPRGRVLRCGRRHRGARRTRAGRRVRRRVLLARRVPHQRADRHRDAVRSAELPARDDTHVGSVRCAGRALLHVRNGCARVRDPARSGIGMGRTTHARRVRRGRGAAQRRSCCTSAGRSIRSCPSALRQPGALGCVCARGCCSSAP